MGSGSITQTSRWKNSLTSSCHTCVLRPGNALSIQRSMSPAQGVTAAVISPRLTSPWRSTSLPPGVVSAGKNRLEWRIQRHTGLGGIYDLPVELRRRSAGPWRCGLEEFARFDAEPVVMAACVPDYSGSLAPGARIVARCGEKPLWICDAAWRNHLFLEGVCLQAENERHRRLIQFLLAQKP